MPSLKLHDLAALRTQTLRRLGVAAAIVSGVLAPLLLGLAQLELGRLLERPHQSVEMDLLFALLMVPPAAWFGARAVRHGAAKGTNFALFACATGAGFLFSLTGALVHALMAHGASLGALRDVFARTCGGAFLSIPLGFMFGALFRIGVGPRMNLVLSPSQAAAAQAAVSCAGMLMVAAVFAHSFDVSALVLATHRLTGVKFDASTLLLWLSVPLALCAAPLLLLGMRELVSLHRARRAILRGTHPEYYPGDIAPDEDAIPLTEADRRSTNKRALMRRESSAYRGGEGDAVRVYVGASA
jgi:hypothetical protein